MSSDELSDGTSFPDSGPLLFYAIEREQLSPAERIPADWWQAVRQRWAPLGWLRRWPVQMRTVRACERLTLRRVLVTEHSSPKPTCDKLDITNYLSHGPESLEVWRCEGSFHATEAVAMVLRLSQGAELRIEAPEAGVWWDARIGFIGETCPLFFHWKSDGAPQPLSRDPKTLPVPAIFKP